MAANGEPEGVHCAGSGSGLSEHFLVQSSEQPHEGGSTEAHCFKDENTEAQRGEAIQ